MSFVPRTYVTMTLFVRVLSLDLFRHHILKIMFIQYEDKGNKLRGQRSAHISCRHGFFVAVTRRMGLVREFCQVTPFL